MTGPTSFRRASEILVGPALERLRRGDPRVVAFLYYHYDYLHADVQRQVFESFWQQLTRTQDGALARRLRIKGINDLAIDFPLLTGMMRRSSDRLWVEAARELAYTNLVDIHAKSSRAAALRQLVVSLPLGAICGAKLRKSVAALISPWPAAIAVRDAIAAWKCTALKRPKSKDRAR